MRGRGKGRSRILYWFRTPPGVRVGRGPLDEEAIRTLEAGNPDLEFDWTRILKGQGDSTPEERRQSADGSERRDGDRRERRQQARGRDRRPAPPVQELAPPLDAGPAAQEIPPEPEIVEPTTAAHARLGSEGLARLRARYSETLARIEERVAEPERQDQLKALAERLNPDTWVTDNEVSAGLESYESIFAELRSGIGPRRKPEPFDDGGEPPPL